jgi:hypothetical protein
MYHGINKVDLLEHHRRAPALEGFFQDVVSHFKVKQNPGTVIDYRAPKPAPKGGQGITPPAPKQWRPKQGYVQRRGYERDYTLFGLGDVDSYGDVVDSSGMYEGQTSTPAAYPWVGSSSPASASPGGVSASGGWLDNLFSSVGGAAAKIITGKANTAVALNNAQNVAALNRAGYNVGLPGQFPSGLLIAGAIGLGAFLLLKK